MDDHHELVEGGAEPVAGGGVGSEFIVATAEVLHKRMSGCQDAWTGGV
jgi:hypothetical protein